MPIYKCWWYRRIFSLHFQSRVCNNGCLQIDTYQPKIQRRVNFSWSGIQTFRCILAPLGSAWNLHGFSVKLFEASKNFPKTIQTEQQGGSEHWSQQLQHVTVACLSEAWWSSDRCRAYLKGKCQQFQVEKTDPVLFVFFWLEIWICPLKMIFRAAIPLISWIISSCFSKNQVKIWL